MSAIEASPAANRTYQLRKEPYGEKFNLNSTIKGNDKITTPFYRALYNRPTTKRDSIKAGPDLWSLLYCYYYKFWIQYHTVPCIPSEKSSELGQNDSDIYGYLGKEVLFNIIRQGDIPIYPVRSFNNDTLLKTKLKEPYNRIAICIKWLLIAPDNDIDINFDKYFDKYNESNPDKIKDFIYEITDDLNIDIIIFQNQLDSDKNTTLFGLLYEKMKIKIMNNHL